MGICMKRRSLKHCIRGWLPLLVLGFAGHASGGPKPETVLAWSDYLQDVNDSLRSRLDPGGSFLWTFEDPKRAAKVRAGEIVIAPAPGQVPKKVPGGLVHHWMGAAFLENVKLDDVLAVTGEYDRYKEFYGPSVKESKLLSSNGCRDAFQMVFLNRSFFMTTAVDADYEVTNVRVDKYRFYSTSNATRIQEIAEYGQPDEHRLPEGEGDGFVWKIYAISRLEQRDDGVYLELEAIELSRGIPAILRFIVDPIVRNVSRKMLFLSIQKTREAVLKSVGVTDNGGRCDVVKGAAAR